MDVYDVPYIYRDSCVDDYMNYLICKRSNPVLKENDLIYKIPVVNSLC